MGRQTGIHWTHRTWNPWRGCHKVSPGCARCYMFREQRRYGHDPTKVTRTKTWCDPPRWNREAEAAGRKFLVFTCSWSDFFIEDADPWRPEAWDVIRRCPNLVFQILTKRPERISKNLPPDWEQGYPNVWVGVSVENQDSARRLDHLLAVPALVHWVSAEPLLGPVDFTAWLDRLDWIVVGAES